MTYELIGTNGTFRLENPDNTGGLYLSLANESGIMNCITPDGHGDSKISQNEFLLAPVSSDDLYISTLNRNFGCDIESFGPWSVWGTSAAQKTKEYSKEKEPYSITVGDLWQQVSRTNQEAGLYTEVLNFCPPTKEKVEIMQIHLKNEGQNVLKIRPIAAIPIYGRSADNLRDHRHVTALLNRVKITKEGVELTPVLSFDERGHQVNETTYGVYSSEDNGRQPGGCWQKPRRRSWILAVE